jgi:hypothetical protein
MGVHCRAGRLAPIFGCFWPGQPRKARTPEQDPAERESQEILEMAPRGGGRLTFDDTVRPARGRSSAFSVSHGKSGLYGDFYGRAPARSPVLN